MTNLYLKFSLLGTNLLFTGFMSFGQVVSSADNGVAGTLRTEIANALPGATITISTNSPILLTNGQILIDKNLTITGMNGTVIDANMASRVFDITAPATEVNISNCTFQNGLESDGGAIRVIGVNLILTNDIFVSNTANGVSGSGGAVYIGSGASLNSISSNFSNNQANRAGGAVEAVAGTMVTFTNGMMLNNNAGVSPAIANPGNGGAFHATGNVTVQLSGTTIENNTAASEGGGLWNGSGTMTINNAIINSNMAFGNASDNGGGGIYQLNNGTLIITNGSITNNVASGSAGSGGGILNDVGATLSVTGTTISGNMANRAGGGIEGNSTAGSNMISLEDVILSMNTTGAAPGNGGGLHMTGPGTILISNSEVTNNSAVSEGGGLWNGSGSMTVQATLIDGNTASGASADNGGGGIYNFNGGNLMIANSTISNNTANGSAGSGGGILNDVGATLSVTGTTISGNMANRAGGGIEGNSTAGSNMISLEDVVLSMNTTGSAPGNGGGLHMTGPGTILISNSEVTNNSAVSEGGGLWNGSGSMTVEATLIDGNTASGALADNGGGGIYNFNGGNLMIANSTISNNTANGSAGSGGGILNDVGSQLMIRNSEISSNSANRAGGGIEDNSATSTLILDTIDFINNTALGTPGNGGGLHITGSGNVTITGGSVMSNTAALEGGGLWNGSGLMIVKGTQIEDNIAQGNASDDGGAGIFNTAGTLTVLNSSFSNNQATGTSGSGGALFSLKGLVSIDSTTFNLNAATRAGGAIEIVDGTLNITTSEFWENDVNGLAGLANPGNGGAIHISDTAVITIENTMFSGNLAGREGGAIWNQTGSTMLVLNTTIDNNSANGAGATNGGGGIFVNGGIVNVMHSTISANKTTGLSANGGGIHVKTGSANITTSTISGNTSLANGGGIYTNAGLQINAATIVNNLAIQNGGGVVNMGTESVQVKNSIIAQNTGVTSDLFVASTPFMSIGFNLIGDASESEISAISSDLIGLSGSILNPSLGPLADNGGTTMTHALLAGSIAYNAGDENDLFSDQIGNPVFDGRRDIGAVESQTKLLAVTENDMDELAVQIYPNPITNDALSISFTDENFSSTKGRILEISSGKIVQNFILTNQVTNLELSPLASGMYLLELTSSKGTSVFRIVKK